MKNRTINIIFGMLLLPFAIILFFVDRIILVFLCWQKSPSIQEYFKQMYNIKMAVYRVSAITVLYLIYLFIKWLL